MEKFRPRSKDEELALWNEIFEALPPTGYLRAMLAGMAPFIHAQMTVDIIEPFAETLSERNASFLRLKKELETARATASGLVKSLGEAQDITEVQSRHIDDLKNQAAVQAEAMHRAMNREAAMKNAYDKAGYEIESLKTINAAINKDLAELKAKHWDDLEAKLKGLSEARKADVVVPPAATSGE